VKVADTDCFVKKFGSESKERYVLVVHEGIRFMGRLVQDVGGMSSLVSQ